MCLFCVFLSVSGSALCEPGYSDSFADSGCKRCPSKSVALSTSIALFIVFILVLLGVGAVAVMGLAVNWVAAQLLALTILFYVFVYSMWLKRTSKQNIVIGGAAGAVPALVGLAALILVTYTPLAIGLGIGSLGLVAIYPFAKRFTWWPQVFLGLAFNWGALLLWAAHTGNLSAAPLFLYAAGFVWTLFYDTIYAHQDKEDDALIGVRSTARLFGENTNRWLAIFMIATVLLMSAASIAALLPLENPLPLLAALAGAWAMGWHMLWQMRRLNIDDPANCLKLFRSNRDTGLLAALFLAAAALL